MRTLIRKSNFNGADCPEGHSQSGYRGLYSDSAEYRKKPYSPDDLYNPGNAFPVGLLYRIPKRVAGCYNSGLIWLDTVILTLLKRGIAKAKSGPYIRGFNHYYN